MTQLTTDRVQVDVDGAHPDIARGSWVVVSQDATDFYRELYEVVGRRRAVAVGVRGLGQGHPAAPCAASRTASAPRATSPCGRSPSRSTLAEAPDDSLVASTTIVVTGDAAGMDDRTSAAC